MISFFKDTKIDFMGARKGAYLFSGLLLLVGFISLALKGGPKTGVDFAGGLLLDVRMSQSVAADDIRNALEGAGLTGAEIQTVQGSDEVLIRVPQEHVPTGAELSGSGGPAGQLQQALSGKYPGLNLEILRQEFVGPKVGKELRGKATMAVIVAVLLIMIYVTVRFHRWEFGVGGALALFHDILVTLGIFSILDREFTLTVLAAFLTIAGYSINDTIVVFDRVRENLGLHKKMPIFDLMNLSINQTLSRTVLTVLTVMMASAALFFLGGKVLHDFALAMLIGVGFGTYSSVFVASAITLDLDRWRQKRDDARAAEAKAQAAAARAAGKGTKSRTASA